MPIVVTWIERPGAWIWPQLVDDPPRSLDDMAAHAAFRFRSRRSALDLLRALRTARKLTRRYVGRTVPLPVDGAALRRRQRARARRRR